MARLRSAASDIGLTLVLAATMSWLAGTMAGRVSPGALPVAAVYLHVWLTLLDGGWTRLRRVTWLLLGLSWAGAVAAGFLGYVLPWGQIRFWLANGWGAAVVTGAAGLLATLSFAADVAAAALIRLRGRPARHVAALLIVAALLALSIWANTPQPEPELAAYPSTPADIVPPWYLLPWYAVLRAPSDKLLGVGLALAAVLLPMAAPWMRAERFRSGAAGVAWPLLCMLLLADFVGLGWLGAQSADGGVVPLSRLLVALWFAFFLLAAPAVRRIGRRDATRD